MTRAEAIGLALTFADAEIPAFPIGLSWNDKKRSIDKKPMSSPDAKNGFYDASTDPARVEEMFRKAQLGPGQEWGVGVRPGPAGYIVLDVDVKNGGTGLEDLDRLTREQGPLPPAMKVGTASGGQHLWLRRPDHPTEIGNGNIAPGIEIRCDRGYVVAPGTVTSWGSWTRDKTTSKLADVEQYPDNWAARLNGRQPDGTKEPIADRLTVGQRHANLLRMGGAMRRVGANRDEILAALRVMNAGRCDPPKPDEELAELAADIPSRYEPEPDSENSFGSSPDSDEGRAAHESTWKQVDIAAFLAGSDDEDKPSVLRRTDGVALIYPGRVHSLTANPKDENLCGARRMLPRT